MSRSVRSVNALLSSCTSSRRRLDECRQTFEAAQLAGVTCAVADRRRCLGRSRCPRFSSSSAASTCALTRSCCAAIGANSAQDNAAREGTHGSTVRGRRPGVGPCLIFSGSAASAAGRSRAASAAEPRTAGRADRLESAMHQFAGGLRRVGVPDVLRSCCSSSPRSSRVIKHATHQRCRVLDVGVGPFPVGRSVAGIPDPNGISRLRTR